MPPPDRRGPLSSRHRRSHRAPGGDPGITLKSFPEAARTELANGQLRSNLRNATDTIRAKGARVVAELPDWEELRDAGKAIKCDALAHLDDYLLQFEAAVKTAGGHVHWARDAAEANAVVADVARAHRADEVIKVKSLTTDEIGLNDALAAAGGPRDHPRHRETRAAVRRPRGFPATAAAFINRRANESVYVAMDGRDRWRRAAGVPCRHARQRKNACPP